MLGRRKSITPSEGGLNQKKLMGKFIHYMNIDRTSVGQPALSSKEIDVFRPGMHHGFAVVHSFMHAVGKLTWWKALLFNLSLWDENAASLQTIIDLPDENPEKPIAEKTLDYYFKQAINFIRFCQASPEQNGIVEITQEFLLMMIPEIISDDTLSFYQQQSAQPYQRDTVLTALSPQLFSKPRTLFLLQLKEKGAASEFQHHCAIRFDYILASWYLYDPRHPSGEEHFDSPEHLYLALNTRYQPAAFQIQIMSFDPHFEATTLAESGTQCAIFESIQRELHCLKKHYEQRLACGMTSGLKGGFFGAYFSISDRLAATQDLLTSVESLLENPDAMFDEKTLTPCQKNGKLGDITNLLIEAARLPPPMLKDESLTRGYQALVTDAEAVTPSPL